MRENSHQQKSGSESSEKSSEKQPSSQPKAAESLPLQAVQSKGEVGAGDKMSEVQSKGLVDKGAEKGAAVELTESGSDQAASSSEAGGAVTSAATMKVGKTASATATAKLCDKESAPKQQDDKSLEPMRTLLSQFTVEFCRNMEPVCTPLSSLEELIADLPDQSKLHEILPEIRDVRHHIQVLVEKVKKQQAYVLIFGPLKSGKSTLMNGICSSYVSEVTTLPAYPCLVNISYSEKPEYFATRYDGTQKEFKDQEDLHASIQRAHVELTFKLREIEGQGKSFDPVVHMPKAYRKIDIKLAAPELATSSAVLVDTPGLYSRMKFGYDQMTRDFRNSAACAIFVVKSDNLFLEQVFEEFTELLDLFSRIFLIVNLDTRKKDLNSDGELVPSLEKKDPQKIIDAFRNLSMSAPLKEAVDDGRLRIYPVDLLSAASTRILANKKKEKNQQVDEKVTSETKVEVEVKKKLPSAVENAIANSSTKREVVTVVSKPAVQPAKPTQSTFSSDDLEDLQSVERFEKLHTDLVEFLNSNDYLKSFLVDSVRRGSSLLNSIQGIVKNPSFAEIKKDMEKLESDKRILERERKVIEQVVTKDWHDHSKVLKEDFADKIKSSAEKVEKTSKSDLEEILDQWWKGDSSLQDLRDQKIRPYFESVTQSYASDLGDFFISKTANRNAGLNISHTLIGDLKIVDIDLQSLVSKAQETAQVTPLQYEFDLDVASIPVKRRFLDWILFRGARRMRSDVFGGEDQADQAIPAGVKEKRLGEPAREVLLQQCEKAFAAIWSSQTEDLSQQIVTQYVDALAGEISVKSESKKVENQKQIAEKEKFIKANAAVIKESATIEKEATDAYQFIKKSYPLPAWPENQSKSPSEKSKSV
ncbi:MAG: dynamin family protein [Verrucomicrobiales bacterium]|nr:dynamin family protein [Verrucomicrobiales bacterium]